MRSQLRIARAGRRPRTDIPPNRPRPPGSSTERGAPVHAGREPFTSPSAGVTPTLRAMKRSTSQVKSFTVPYRSIVEPHTTSFPVYGPGQFQQ